MKKKYIIPEVLFELIDTDTDIMIQNSQWKHEGQDNTGGNAWDNDNTTEETEENPDDM